jgi:ACS family hexuronate transporter-like MFS transporter
MLISAVLTLPMIFAMSIDSLWGAVFVVGLATAAHQSFSCNLYTLPSDLFPRSAVGTVVGIGGTAGAVGGMLMAKFTGWILDRTGSYTPIFVIAAFAYLIALAVIQILAPRYEVAKVDTKAE